MIFVTAYVLSNNRHRRSTCRRHYNDGGLSLCHSRGHRSNRSRSGHRFHSILKSWMSIFDMNESGSYRIVLPVIVSSSRKNANTPIICQKEIFQGLGLTYEFKWLIL